MHEAADAAVAFWVLVRPAERFGESAQTLVSPQDCEGVRNLAEAPPIEFSGPCLPTFRNWHFSRASRTACATSRWSGWPSVNHCVISSVARTRRAALTICSWSFMLLRTYPSRRRSVWKLAAPSTVAAALASRRRTLAIHHRGAIAGLPQELSSCVSFSVDWLVIRAEVMCRVGATRAATDDCRDLPMPPTPWSSVRSGRC